MAVLCRTGFLMLLFFLPLSLLAAFNTKYVPTIVRVFSSAAEQKIAEELAEDKLTSFSLVDAALIASGAISEKQLAQYRDRYQSLVEKIKHALPGSGWTVQRRAAKIFELMFEYAMKAYQSDQTTLIEIFDEGYFNCVSATLLYNLLCAEFGVTTRVVVVPAHVYSQIRTGNSWIDVETTSSSGFHPLRERGNSNPGGRVFIEDRGHPGNKSFISTSRLVAFFYYNRGTLAHTQGRSEDAVSLLLRALSIFPLHRESSENLLATMLEWAQNEGQAGNTTKAMQILNDCEQALGPRQETATLRDGLIFSAAQSLAAKGDFAAAIQQIEQYLASLPSKTAQQTTILRGYLLQWAQQNMQQGKYQEMLTLLDRAARQGQDSFVDSMRLHLITESAKQISRSQGYSKGYRFFDQHYPRSIENNAIRQNRLHLYGLWIANRIEAGKFEEAYLLNRSLSELYPSHQDVRNNTAWIIQRWMTAISTNTPIPLMLEMYRKYREPLFIDELVNRTIREINRLQQNRLYEQAENLVQQTRALKINGQADARLANLHRVILFNWSIFHAKRDEYRQSIEIGKRAHALFPQDRALETNLVSFYYNAGLTLINTRQYEQAAQLLDDGLGIFPGNQNLLKLQQYLR